MSNYAIYQPKGKAGEYAKWACNFYTGCSNDCAYCYCKRGALGSLWSNVPRLKKCFTGDLHAMKVFMKELEANINELRKDGLFFSFTTDPLLPSTRALTLMAAYEAASRGVSVSILTKRSDIVELFDQESWLYPYRKYIAIGFTLTGCDEAEGYASPNDMRIRDMKSLHILGYPTFASIEPVLDPAKSLKMMAESQESCDLFKVGLESGGNRLYGREELKAMYDWMYRHIETPIYLKDSFVNALAFDRKALPKNFVGTDYNVFNSLV
ncbi:MAG: hypothetical protein LIP09_12180 [Bacteroidales bacterium]|nr:hypothetical protein [Bacteroidales bacterium]